MELYRVCVVAGVCICRTSVWLGEWELFPVWQTPCGGIPGFAMMVSSQFRL